MSKNLLNNSENLDAYDGLIVSLEANQGKLNLLICVCDDNIFRDEIINKYEQELDNNFQTHKININKNNLSLTGELNKLVNEYPTLTTSPQVVITVTGTENLSNITFRDKSDLDTFLGYLQWTREAFREFPYSIILWINNAIESQLQQKAPDFWSWRKGVFRFTSISTLGKLWKILNTPIFNNFDADNANDFASSIKDGSEAIFKLGEIFSKPEVKNLPEVATLLNKTDTLFDILNSPWATVISGAVPFLPVATGLLKVYLDVTKTEPTLSQSVALITQAAYLESLKSYLDSHPDLKEWLTTNNLKPSQSIIGLIKKLDNFELDDYQARFALVYFPESELAHAFNNILTRSLLESAIDNKKCDSISASIAYETPRFIETILSESEATESIKKIKDWYTLGGKEVFEKYLSIDTYLKERIATLPQESVFGENFTFNDIYVPLKAKPLDANGKETYDSQSFILQDWVKETILDDKQKDKVIVIQAGPGRGKSVFCRMFADKVRQELHPRLTPIFIRLRDIQHFEGNFQETLKNALSNVDFVNTDDGWLTDRNTHYLFILDGFDELSIEGRSKVSLDSFLQQIAQFQKDMTTTETGHRVILTGRTIAFQGLRLPNNLTQVTILTMDEGLQKEWLGKWQKVVDVDATVAETKTKEFAEFLTAEDCPEQVRKELAVEPLLLYMLGAMHRDEAIKLTDFQGNNKTQAKITIYEKAFEWVLTKQREKWLQAHITGLNEDNFYEVMEAILTESAMAVVQSGGESAQLQMIEARLKKQDGDLVKIIEELKKKDRALNTALGAFYIKATDKTEGGVEFYHKSFSEFLCAKRLYLAFEDWVRKVPVSRRKEIHYISDEQLAEQIYDLLGYGGLTVEIVDYLRGLLDKYSNLPDSQEQEISLNPPSKEGLFDFGVEKIVDLFNRLYDFYLRWCDGEFIDAEGTTLPQTKQRELKPYVSKDTNLGLRQVDVLTGLNVMILLLELHRYGIDSGDEELKQDLNFHPCGEVDEEGKPKDEDLLLKIIGYSHCLGITGFVDTVGEFLYNANLEDANLNNANLNNANLEDANLEDANLNNANLEDANLNNANLNNANLNNANLNNANLNNANLNNAYLNNANLNNAYLNYANLYNAYLNNAYLNYANLYNAYLNYANLYNANLNYANLYNANLTNAENLTNANLYNANLTNAENLTNAQIKSARNWETAYYAKYWDADKKEWVVDEEKQQAKLQELRE